MENAQGARLVPDHVRRREVGLQIDERRPIETVYDLRGTRLEACSCGVLCPCWVGEDPDGGSCDALFAYHFDRGTIQGVDVGGLTMVVVTRIAGNNRVPGSWRIVVLVDERASDAQLDAVVAAYSGELGGPLPGAGGVRVPHRVHVSDRIRPSSADRRFS